MYPSIGALIAKEILIIKLLIESTVARLLEVVFSLIELRKIGVTMPLKK